VWGCEQEQATEGQQEVSKQLAGAVSIKDQLVTLQVALARPLSLPMLCCLDPLGGWSK